MIEWLLALAISESEPVRSASFDHQAFCSRLEDFARSPDAQSGRLISPNTRNGGAFVYCERRAIELRTLLNVPLRELEDWLEAQKAIWSDDHCSDATTRAALQHGWTLTAVIVATDGSQVSFQAVCNTAND